MDGLVLDRAIASVFRLDDRGARMRWRERKLATRPASAAALVVEVRDPCRLTPAERAALLERCARANMAIYASARVPDDPAIPRRMAAQLGLDPLAAEPLAEAEGIARVPWHTAGHDSVPGRPVRSMLLHCAQAAGTGGELSLLDAELAWLLLGDIDTHFVAALMQRDAMTIPPAGYRLPAFAVEASGDLHLRFTERRDDVAWKCDATVSEAAARLRRLLDRDASCVLKMRLAPGMGLVANNVLQSRSALAEGESVVRRARFQRRIAGTEGAWRALLG